MGRGHVSLLATRCLEVLVESNGLIERRARARLRRRSRARRLRRCRDSSSSGSSPSTAGRGSIGPVSIRSCRPADRPLRGRVSPGDRSDRALRTSVQELLAAADARLTCPLCGRRLPAGPKALLCDDCAALVAPHLGRNEAGLSGLSAPGRTPRTFEPEYAGLEGQYFVQAKLQAHAPGRGRRPLTVRSGRRSHGSGRRGDQVGQSERLRPETPHGRTAQKVRGVGRGASGGGGIDRRRAGRHAEQTMLPQEGESRPGGAWKPSIERRADLAERRRRRVTATTGTPTAR